MTTLMVDCIAADIPAVRAAGLGHLPAAGYVTGGWPIEWAESDFDLFTRKIRIAQSFDLAADDASIARVLDVELGAARPAWWPLFWAARTNKADATCYCSLDTVPAVVAACQAASIPPPSRWWLAWYWGKPGEPTAAQVNQELGQLTGYVLEQDTIWAVQYAAYAQWDLSVVYGTPDFSRR